MHQRSLARRLLTAVAGSVVAAALVVVAPPHALAQDNGLARTPPMGWNDWNTFACNVDETLIKQTADLFVSSGLKAAGYTYVNVDDCWMAPNRDGNGNLVADPVKFPSGMKSLADYVHARGLKFGIYESGGTTTCQNLPGSLGHERADANSFAAWGVDYLKYDNCANGSSTKEQYIQRYTAMRDALLATGRPIVYSICEWGYFDPATWAPAVGNLWRTTGDIEANYGSMLSIFHANAGLAAAAGPGAWNDPDMLEVGNGMRFTEDRAQFSLWSAMAAPLLSGADLRTASPATFSLYLNSDVIAVDQDTLGKQATEVSAAGGLDVLAKPLSDGGAAVTLFNEGGSRQTISTTASAAGLPAASSYKLTNLWTKEVTTSSGAISASVPAHGVVMYRVAPGSGSSTGTTHPLLGSSSGRCVDVNGGSTTAGTAVNLWDCNGGSNQGWTFTNAGELRAFGGTQCLDATGNGTAAGTKLIIWPCSGAANQQWRLNADGSITGVQSGLCVDVTGGDKPAGNVNGTPLELWSCNDDANQAWSLKG
ncbi:alpha-galactosidase [Amycolatopsis sp. NBC_00345]|uniref:glycoside hydrolase family 27 protein n=1 Tax=Amycolatopsis sp. NBC_00345 TaxID=2975955 RepID=UPI002E26ADF0